MADGNSLWSKNFIAVTVSRMFSSATFNLYNVTIAAITMSTYGVNAGVAGACVTVFLVGTILSRLVAGRAVDVAGPKRIMIASGVVFIAMSLLYQIPMPLGALFVLRFVHGAVFGFVNTVACVAVVDYLPADRFGEGMAFFSVGACLATAVGPFTGMAVLNAFGTNVLFGMATLYAVCSLAPAFLIDGPKRQVDGAIGASGAGTRTGVAEAGAGSGSGAAGSEQKRTFRITDYVEPAALPISALIFTCSLGYASTTAFVGTYAALLDVAVFSEIYFVGLSVSMIVTQPFAGKLLDRRGLNTVFIPAMLLLSAGIGLLALATNAPVLIAVAGLLAGAGFSSMNTAGQASVVSSVPSHRVGVATSTFFIFTDLGLGVGPMVLGAVSTVVGYAGMYVVGSLAVLIVLVFYIIMQAKGHAFGAARRGTKGGE